MKKIIFTNTLQDEVIIKPIPSQMVLPDWYKKINSYRDNNKKGLSYNSFTNGTIKKCMPVFDAITAGYIIPLPADVWVTIENGFQKFTWANYNLIQFHSEEQVTNHPNSNGQDMPKWVNPWAIKTPKGYSTMFVQPFHRQSVFTILPGIVDTDKFNHPVNLPFVMNDTKWEGLIPQGTPIAQVIPFKRDNWKSFSGTEEDVKKSNEDFRILQNRFFDRYKNLFRTPKEYK
jgi:hypothetical protein